MSLRCPQLPLLNFDARSVYLKSVALVIAVLSLISVAGCQSTVVKQISSLQGTRTEEWRDWVRNDLTRDKLLVFIHGFNSNKDDAWGKFPDLIKTDDDFAPFNLHRFGYRTSIVGQSTDIEHEGELLASFLQETLSRYHSTVLIGHSMGGLVILHALLTLERDAAQLLRDGNLKVITFGTPYQGVKNAEALAALFNNQQARDMEIFSRQYVRLRENWEARFNRSPVTSGRETLQIPIFAYSGTADEFVAEASARGAPGSVADRGPVDGDHISMVKPNDRDHLAYTKLKKAAALTGVQRAPPTTQGKIGIWVARLTGDDASHAAQRNVARQLEFDITQEEPQLQNLIEVRELAADVTGHTPQEKETQVRRLGQGQHAAIVVWGDVTGPLIHPRITLVEPLPMPTKTAVLPKTEAFQGAQPSAPPGNVSAPS